MKRISPSVDKRGLERGFSFFLSRSTEQLSSVRTPMSSLGQAESQSVVMYVSYLSADVTMSYRFRLPFH